jgi:hypothetical protein
MATRPKTGGRRRGSIDREERKVLTDKMAGDLVWCYQKMGGRDWLLEFAKANPAEFIKSGLSRLWPAPARDDEAGNSQFNQFNIGGDTFESARRVAFLLSSAMHPDPSVVIEHDIPVAERVPPEPVTPQEMPRWRPPSDAPDMTYELDPERAEWAASLPLSPQERADQLLIKQTKETTLETYHGGLAEQGGSGMTPRSNGKPSAGELCRRLSRRGQSLL